GGRGVERPRLPPPAPPSRPSPAGCRAPGGGGPGTYGNVSLATTPHAGRAALEGFGARRIALLVGGHDRGVDWSAFAEAVAHRPPAASITMGANGPRINELLAPPASRGPFGLAAAGDLADALRAAAVALPGEGGAP